MSGLNGICAFEINGYAQGVINSGKYCVIHAIALNSYAGKGGRIYLNHNYYGWKWWQRITLRWIGRSHFYELQIKTCSDYGFKGRIIVSVKDLLNEFETVN